VSGSAEKLWRQQPTLKSCWWCVQGWWCDKAPNCSSHTCAAASMPPYQVYEETMAFHAADLPRKPTSPIAHPCCVWVRAWLQGHHHHTLYTKSKAISTCISFMCQRALTRAVCGSGRGSRAMTWLRYGSGAKYKSRGVPPLGISSRGLHVHAANDSSSSSSNQLTGNQVLNLLSH
jgi:hypothetical protein